MMRPMLNKDYVLRRQMFEPSHADKLFISPGKPGGTWVRFRSHPTMVWFNVSADELKTWVK